ncbi:MAG: HTTM domain-containing protein [Sandaracinaceae bacterium]|nr:HTTM domain-containing protein [Sandaracinaceae bacterium]
MSLRSGWRPRVRAAISGSALDLAVFRITVALVIAASSSAMVAVDWASLPAATRVAPLGVGFLLPHLPITPELVTGVRAVMYAACVTGALGLFSRTSFALVTVSAAYVLLIPQLGGAVFHDHHLLWFAALLAASPCGDALSVDAWRARRRAAALPVGSPAHGLALRFAWLCVGLIYFFPAVHKLRAMGLDWALSDNLRHQLWWKWAQDPTLLPRFRIDRVPWLLHGLAALTLLFELSFVLLVFVRRTRLLAVAAALAFHAGTHLLMGIDFSVLYACYTMFLPWSSWLARVRETAPPEPLLIVPSATQPVPHTLIAVGALLVTGVVAAGAAGAMQAYPFACYPTFAFDPGPSMPALRIDVLHADGREERLPPALYRAPGPRGVALEWRLLGAYGDFSEPRLRAWWQDEVQREPLRGRVRHAREVRFSRARVSVNPDDRGAVGDVRPLLTLLTSGPAPSHAVD